MLLYYMLVEMLSIRRVRHTTLFQQGDTMVAMSEYRASSGFSLYRDRGRELRRNRRQGTSGTTNRPAPQKVSVKVLSFPFTYTLFPSGSYN